MKSGLPIPTAAELPRYAGEYFAEELNTKYSITVDGAALVLIGPRGQRVQLRPLETHEFAGGPFNLQFTADASGAVNSFALGQGRVRGLRFTRVRSF